MLEIFNFGNKQIRTVVKNEIGYFVAKDLCDVLEVKNPSDALSRLDDDEKDDIVLTDTVGKRQGYSIVNESGMFSLVLSSRKPEAKVFRKWVTSEVLPSIRKTGVYGVGNFTQAEMNLRFAQHSVDLEKRVSRLEDTISTIILPVPVPAITFKPIVTKKTPIVYTKTDRESVKNYFNFLGIKASRGTHSGIGKTCTFACKKAGIEQEYIPSGPRSKTMVPLYPKGIILTAIKNKGLLV